MVLQMMLPKGLNVTRRSIKETNQDHVRQPSTHQLLSGQQEALKKLELQKILPIYYVV